MDKKQYNNIIDWTQQNQPETQTEDSLTAVRAVCNNMGVALPQGDLAQVAETLATDDYMGWKACTQEEAQEAANNGIPAIGVNENGIVLLAADDEEQPVAATAAVMTLARTNIENNNATNMAYYSYGSSTTTTTIPIAPSIPTEPTIPVQSITMCDSTYTMNVGENAYLSYSIHPANATNKSVVWCSCNPTVATINSSTGKITAKKVGTTQITVRTNDGCFVASCLLSVYIDTVTVKKDGNFNKVVFATSGKVWYCINRDMIFDDNNMYNSILIDRSNKNYYVQPGINNVDLRTYSNDEMKLLYAIDPYGVADYVNRYASGLFYEDGLKSVLDYKDSVFELLFRRKPKYFARTIDGSTWYETTDTSDLTDVISESESVFGMHPIWDDYTTLQLIEAAITVVDIALSLTLNISTLSSFLKSHKKIKIAVKIFCFIVSTASGGLVSAMTATAFESFFENTYVDWAYQMVSLYDNFQELVTDFDLGESFYPQVFDYCSTKLNYRILLEMKDGQKYSLNEISEHLKQY